MWQRSSLFVIVFVLDWRPAYLAPSNGHLIDRLTAASAPRRAVIGGLLAAVSAILSNYSQLFVPAFFNVPPLPAIWFAATLSVIGLLWATRSPFELTLLFVGSILAWVVAYNAAMAVDQHFVTLAHPVQDLGPGKQPIRYFGPPPDYTECVSGLVAGLMGAIIVAYFSSIVFKDLRTALSWAKIVAFGALAGVLLELQRRPGDGSAVIHIGSQLPMFFAWQISIAACIAFDLKPRFAKAGSLTSTAPVDETLNRLRSVTSLS